MQSVWVSAAAQQLIHHAECQFDRLSGQAPVKAHCEPLKETNKESLYLLNAAAELTRMRGWEYKYRAMNATLRLIPNAVDP